MTHLDILTAFVIVQAFAIIWMAYDKPSSDDHHKVDDRTKKALRAMAVQLVRDNPSITEYAPRTWDMAIDKVTHVVTEDLKLVEVTTFINDNESQKWGVLEIAFAPVANPSRVIRTENVLLYCSNKKKPEPTQQP